MIKGQQDISKLRNEMGDINKAGAGRKFLCEMKRMFDRSRKAKFPKGTSHRKDMGIGSSVQSFKPKNTTQSQKTGKSAGEDNDVNKGGRLSFMRRLGDKIANKEIATRWASPTFIEPGIKEKIGMAMRHVEPWHEAVAAGVGAGGLGYAGYRHLKNKKKTRKLNDINDMLKDKFGGVERGNPAKVRVPPEDLPALKVKFTTDKYGDRYYTCPKCQYHGGTEIDAGHVLCRGCGRKVIDTGNTAMKSLGAQINDLNKSIESVAMRYFRGGGNAAKKLAYRKKMIARARRLQRPLMRAGYEPNRDEALRLAGKFRPEKGTKNFNRIYNQEFGRTHKSLGAQINDLRKDVLHGDPSARWKGHTVYPPKPSNTVSITGSHTKGAEAYKVRHAASRVRPVQHAAQEAARKGKVLRSVGAGLGAAAAVGGGALLARHLLRRHQAKKAARMAATNPAAGSVAQGMMGCLANMQKRMDRMRK